MTAIQVSIIHSLNRKEKPINIVIMFSPHHLLSVLRSLHPAHLKTVVERGRESAERYSLTTLASGEYGVLELVGDHAELVL